jgi:HEAT repeat protein
MTKSKMNLIVVVALLLAGSVQSFGQTVPPSTPEQVNKLIAVIKSDAPQKEKVDACRQLSVIGTKDAVAPLAALLGDEKLSHMARYALEPNPDPSVDEALRDALGTLKGIPLVGVIGSIGVRRDPRAVRPLSGMLADPDAEVAQAAARALGSIGNQRAARVLQRALPNVPAGNQLAFCEGLFRCAESLVARGQRDRAIEIYDQLRSMEAAHQVRGGALRSAILARGEDGIALLKQHLGSDDYILFSAAVQTSMEIPGSDVTEALTSALKGLPADNQILIIAALGKRADPAALPALTAAAKEGEKPVRIAAIQALPQIGDASVVPVLKALAADADGEISQAAQQSMAAF